MKLRCLRKCLSLSKSRSGRPPFAQVLVGDSHRSVLDRKDGKARGQILSHLLKLASSHSPPSLELFLSVFIVHNRGLLGSSGWPQAQDPPALASLVLKLQMCNIVPPPPRSWVSFYAYKSVLQQRAKQSKTFCGAGRWHST